MFQLTISKKWPPSRIAANAQVPAALSLAAPHLFDKTPACPAATNGAGLVPNLSLPFKDTNARKSA